MCRAGHWIFSSDVQEGIGQRNERGVGLSGPPQSSSDDITVLDVLDDFGVMYRLTSVWKKSLAHA